jgi:hypothetical protein
MRNVKVVLLFLSSLGAVTAFGQKTCTSTPFPINSDINFADIIWVATDGATVSECNDMADGLITFVGDVRIDVSNNRKVTITNNVNIDGNFPISGGPGSTLSVNGGFRLYVTGDLGDATSNGVQYEVVTSTDEIRVDGTLYGKNDNAFTGDGKISGGYLNVKNGTTCGTPCPVTGGFNQCTSGDAFCTSSGALPVLLLHFEAKPDHDRGIVQLLWATSLEESFQEFIVQRSDNGEDFYDLETVKGQGRDVFNIESRYSFEDKAPLIGFNYYRLKAVDLDGSTEYFRIIAVKLSGPKRLVVFPNPSQGSTINFRTNFAPDESDRVIIINALGNELINASATSLGNSIHSEEPLQSGMYILKYTSRDFEIVSRVIVNH